MTSIEILGATTGAMVMIALGIGSQAGAQHDASRVQASGDPNQTFVSLCVPCHGPQGKGDGPAAVAFNPRPADFTKAELWVERTDEELVTSITKGVNAMPPFGPQLSQEEIRGLVAYIKSLRVPSTP